MNTRASPPSPSSRSRLEDHETRLPRITIYTTEDLCQSQFRCDPYNSRSVEGVLLAPDFRED